MSTNNLFVRNLPFDSTEDDLKNLFSEVGNVLSVKIIKDRDNNNKSKGFGFVEMGSVEDAEAIKEQEFNLGGRPVYVADAKPQVKR